MQGEVYVPVEANEMQMATMSMQGSGSATTTFATIHWTLAGGVSGQIPFESLNIMVTESDNEISIGSKITDYLNAQGPHKFNILVDWATIGCAI